MIPSLSSERWRRLSALLDKALALPAGERAGYLDSACGEDAELRRMAAEVLSEAGEDRNSLERLVDRFASSVLRGMSPESPESPTGDGAEAPTRSLHATGVVDGTVGPYRLLEKVGEGGMGEVWRAEQTVPLRREVALKLIKAGLDTRQIVARFEAERQALALMNHPAIARVFEAGETSRGLPYFAMEYVRGEPITAYCDRHRLGTRERIELFAQVCEGVQHAHQKGIIHRDLKPSNVLVAIQGDRPIPKIIDFGVAKAVSQRLTERTMYTERGVLVGTPEYMSPEQAEMTGLDVDTRSDVYALGIIFYQLLVGVLPFDPAELRTAGFDEIRRRIREVEPPRPSTRMRALGEAAREAARNRQMEPRDLANHLRGDLDWITMKALEKDRTRRYGSPADLAADLTRYLRHEPVLAGPPSTAYRMKKFVRRHRFGVVATCIVALALIGGVITSTTLYLRSKQSERQARTETQKAFQVTSFLRGMLASADPKKAKGRELTVREVLDEAGRTIETDLADLPEVQEAVRLTLAETYEGLGYGDAARPHMRWVVEFRRRKHGEADERTLIAYRQLGISYHTANRNDEAAMIYRDIMGIASRNLGNEHPRTIDAMSMYGNALKNRGDHEEAEQHLRRALEIAERVFKPGDETYIWHETFWNLADLYRQQGRYREARPLYGRAVAMAPKVWGEEGLWTIRVLREAGQMHLDAGWLASAETIIEDSVARARRSLGKSHPITAWTIITQGVLRRAQEDLAGAEECFREALLILDRSNTATPHTHNVQDALAGLLVGTGRVEEARSLTREVLSWARRRSEAEDAREGALIDYAEHLITCKPEDERDPASAAALAERALAMSGRRLPFYLDILARAYAMAGATDRAIEVEREAIALLPIRWTIQGERVEQFLVRLLEENGDVGEAEGILSRTLARRKEGLAADHPDIATALATLAEALARHGKSAQAVSNMREALAIRSRVLPADDWQVAHTRVLLGNLLAQAGARSEAEKLLRQGYSELQDNPDAPLEKVREAESRLNDLPESRSK